MSSEAIRSWIVSAVRAGAGDAPVHAAMPLTDDDEALRRAFGGADGAPLHGWAVTRIGVARARVGASRAWAETSRWRIEGYRALRRGGAEETETAFEHAVAGVLDAIAAATDAVDAQAPESRPWQDLGTGDGGAREFGADESYVMFAGALCRSARVEFSTTSYEEIGR